ncbi:MAG: hypothetical protein KDA81_20745 [Planctomycetaceae bacterium]|nr:hypothetical protein [Planctomycetaceae bacterium]
MSLMDRGLLHKRFHVHGLNSDLRRTNVRRLISRTFRQQVLLLTMHGWLCSWPLHAGTGDLTIRTSHPHYPGEGAFQSIDDCVQFAVGEKSAPQERALAMYNWFLTHQWHLMSPMEWCVPGRIPDSLDAGDYETVLFDANLARFSFGYGLCGTVHAWNEPYWKVAGFPARRREFPDHVNSEIFYDGRWHAFDTDMAGLLFRSDGIVAGYDDIINDASLVHSVRPPVPHYPFDWPSDADTMKKGWHDVAARKTWYALYNGGYAADPGIVHLRKGESFTRWYDRDHFGGFEKRRFWQNQKGGPFRQWTFFNNGEPFHKDGKSNSRSAASYCNGIFVYEPPLTSTDLPKQLCDQTANVSFNTESPHVRSSDDQTALVTFDHRSPYVICGDPVDNQNPMSADATDGLILEGRCLGDVVAEVSVNQGQSWMPVSLISASSPATDKTLDSPGRSFRTDLTNAVKGRYGWQIRFQFSGNSGLDHLKFTTTTQCNQAMYPRLTESGCDVTVRSQPRAVVPVIPDFGRPESETSHYEVPELRSSNLRYQPRSRHQRYAFLATDNKPAHVVFHVDSVTRLTEVRAAVRYQVPVPPTKGCRYQLEVSTDEGVTWTEFAVADIPDDNEFSSGWLYGSTPISNEAECRRALIRFVMHSPGRPAALIDARLYGLRETAASDPTEIEFGWLENGQERSFRQVLSAGFSESRFTVPTQAAVQDQYVRISVPANESE